MNEKIINGKQNEFHKQNEFQIFPDKTKLF